MPHPLGYSAHHMLELSPARRRAVDYVTYSPIFPTSSKPGHPGTGVDALRRFSRQAGVPVLALGGLTPERVASCRRAGAAGIAVLSGIMHADDPTRAAQAYAQAWKEAA
jgi:thiamine-phosphate pyrophosphorylase